MDVKLEGGRGEKGNGVNLCQYCPFFPARDGRGSSFRAIVWPRILKALTRSSNRRRLEENKETVVAGPGAWSRVWTGENRGWNHVFIDAVEVSISREYEGPNICPANYSSRHARTISFPPFLLPILFVIATRIILPIIPESNPRPSTTRGESIFLGLRIRGRKREEKVSNADTLLCLN